MQCKHLKVLGGLKWHVGFQPGRMTLYVISIHAKMQSQGLYNIPMVTVTLILGFEFWRKQLSLFTQQTCILIINFTCDQ